MATFERITIKKNERALLLRNGDFERVLHSGSHWLIAATDALQVERFSLGQARFQHELVDYLFTQAPDVVAAEFTAVQLAENEVGLRSENGVLVEILPPATRALYWKGLVQTHIDTIDVQAVAQLPDDLLKRITNTQLRSQGVQNLGGVLQVQVPEGHAGLLRIDGQVQPLLRAGNYGFWRYGRHIEVALVDLRLQTQEVSGQEIMTRDKVSLRLNLQANYRFSDVLNAHAQLQKPADYLYRELQFALRAAVGTRSLDELLADKTSIDQAVMAHMAAKLPSFGMQLESVGVKDIVLPGEMKTILTQVVQAEKQAEANLIRRREETAATRSLLNTAKVMENNPVALRMKELETLERVAERIDKISVFGGLDQVLNGLVQIRQP